MGQMNVQKLVWCFLLVGLFFMAPAAALSQSTPAEGSAHIELVGEASGHVPLVKGNPEEAHEHEAHPPALPTVIGVFNSIKTGDGHTLGDTAFGKFIADFEKQIYVVFITIMMLLFFNRVRKSLSVRPGKLQVAMEMLVEGLVTFFTGIVGNEHKKHVPFLCSLFLFLWVNNLTALVPGMAPMTAYYRNTLTFAVLVFVYFIYFGIRDGGLGHFLWHMLGSPKDPVGWLVSPFIFILEIVGNLAKPLSLSLRLFGNILGEDILLGVSLMLGILMATAITPDPMIGVPLHLPFMFLVFLGGTIQALVFSLLSAIYIAMVLPHHDEDGHHDETTDEHPLLPGADAKSENSLHVDAGAAPFVG